MDKTYKMAWTKRERREDLTLEREQLLRCRTTKGGEGEKEREEPAWNCLAMPLTSDAVIKIEPSMSWYQHTT